MSQFTGYILFYSRDQNSNNFISLIESKGLSKFFVPRSIDSMKTEEIAESGIKEVPTVIERFPNGYQMYGGKKAFEWLGQKIQAREQTMINQVTEQRRRIIQMNAQNGKNSDMLMGHKPLETSGVSDTFAYVDLNQPQPKAFMQYGSDEQNRIFTFGGKEDKITINNMEKIKTDYEKKLKVQNEMIEKGIERQLIETVYNAETGKHN